MVTIRPIPKIEIRCNACDKIIGYLDKEDESGELYLQAPKDAVGTFQRMRLYDVKNDGEHLYDHEYEVDFCDDCSEDFKSVVEAYGLNKSQVEIKEVSE